VLATIGVAAASAAISQPALADPPPATASYTLKKDYPTDAKLMLDNMKLATDMTRGTPGMEDTVKQTRSEMNDFVAFYRRQPKVAGMPSFSTMYTAINTLSGHYASYGNKYPVPEKRKVRLQQQYKEIDRALARGK
jgi:photosystem II Psb27 protein